MQSQGNDERETNMTTIIILTSLVNVLLVAFILKKTSEIGK